MDYTEFTEFVQMIESNLKFDLSYIDVQLEGYKKYYSELEFKKMKEEYDNIISANKSTNPTTYSYIHDVFCDITNAYAGIEQSDMYPPFGIIDTSRYNARKAKDEDGSVQAIFIDFGLIWGIHLISDVLISHLLSYQKDGYDNKDMLSGICGIMLHLIDHKIHEISNNFNLKYEEMVLASYLEYAMTTFVCAHEYIHYIYSHDASISNEYEADLQGTFLTMQVIHKKWGDDRVGILGVIVLLLFLSAVEDIDKNKTYDIQLEPKKRLKLIFDKVMPEWLLVAKNKKLNIVDKLFIGDCITNSMNELYNEIDAIFSFSCKLIKEWRHLT